KRFFGETATTHISGDAILVLQPSTLMNLSGRAVSAVISFYKYKPEEILVVHDELDLPPGSIKYKIGGGCAGHNGLKSISSLIGSQNFQRLRIGIGHPRDKQLQTPVADYVLSRPSPDDRILISQAVAKGIEFLPLIAEGKTEDALQKINS
ncbi:aminoacyl-tRNA hydrolase, partial [Turicimonas muris]